MSEEWDEYKIGKYFPCKRKEEKSPTKDREKIEEKYFPQKTKRREEKSRTDKITELSASLIGKRGKNGSVRLKIGKGKKK